MNKIKNILFSIVYLLFTIGVVVSSHYCLGRISHQDLFSFDNHGCMCDNILGDADDCCKDEVNVILMEDDQQISSSLSLTAPKRGVIYSLDLLEMDIDQIDDQKLISSNFEDPPPNPDQPLYQLNCTYTFYG